MLAEAPLTGATAMVRGACPGELNSGSDFVGSTDVHAGGDPLGPHGAHGLPGLVHGSVMHEGDHVNTPDGS